MNKAPERLAHVHPLLLEHAYASTDGDWSRVAVDGNGGLMILNHSVRHAPAKAKAPAVPAGKKKTAAKTKAPVKTTVKVPLNRDPQPEGEHVEKTYQQVLVPKKTTVPAELPKHLDTPAPVMRQTRPDPEPVKMAEPPKRTETIRDRLSAAERLATQKMRQPLQVTDIPIPPEFDIKAAWEDLDAELVATSILNVCRKGLPMSLPLDMHPEVLALEGINLELVATSVRNPNYVEIAGLETKAKGYPVLRFFRGDITTVVGLRDTRLPMTIATYAHSRLDADQHRVNSMKGSGGGGARKQTGLPGTSALVAKRLRQMGAEVAVDELSDKPAPVKYRGQDLGMISQKGSRTQCESDYQRIVRKMEAIARRK